MRGFLAGVVTAGAAFWGAQALAGDPPKSVPASVATSGTMVEVAMLEDLLTESIGPVRMHASLESAASRAESQPDGKPIAAFLRTRADRYAALAQEEQRAGDNAGCVGVVTNALQWRLNQVERVQAKLVGSEAIRKGLEWAADEIEKRVPTLKEPWDLSQAKAVQRELRKRAATFVAEGK